MKILLTGGLGYIGSVTCAELIKNGHEVVIVDNLSNSSIDVLQNIKKVTNVTRRVKTDHLLKRHTCKSLSPKFNRSELLYFFL